MGRILMPSCGRGKRLQDENLNIQKNENEREQGGSTFGIGNAVVLQHDVLNPFSLKLSWVSERQRVRANRASKESEQRESKKSEQRESHVL